MIEPVVLPNVLVRARVLEFRERVAREWREIVAFARQLDQEEREAQAEDAARAAVMEERRKVSPGSALCAASGAGGVEVEVVAAAASSE